MGCPVLVSRVAPGKLQIHPEETITSFHLQCNHMNFYVCILFQELLQTNATPG